MSYEVSVPPESDFVQVRWTEAPTSSAMQRVGVEALKCAEEHSLSRMIVDLSDVTSHLEVGVLYLGTADHALLGPPRPRVALLGRSDQWRELELVENTGANRGMPIRSFVDRASALEWLRS